MTGLFLIIIIPVASLIATLAVRWIANRPEPQDLTPITPEELYREKPAIFVADVSYEYIDILLESIEDTLDSGFSESQRELLVQRLTALAGERITYAVYPVQFLGQSSDLLMHFMRFDEDTVRCRFEATPLVINRVKTLISRLPHKAAV